MVNLTIVGKPERYNMHQTTKIDSIKVYLHPEPIIHVEDHLLHSRVHAKHNKDYDKDMH